MFNEDNLIFHLFQIGPSEAELEEVDDTPLMNETEAVKSCTKFLTTGNAGQLLKKCASHIDENATDASISECAQDLMVNQIRLL